MGEHVLFEHPMNERFRLLLRLEHLFALIRSSRDCGNECADRTVLTALSDVLQITGRNNVKQDVLRCIERQHERFSAMKSADNVDHGELKRVLNRLTSLSKRLHEDASAIGSELQAHPLLEGVRRRALQPGGTSPVDMPDLHRWLSQPPDRRASEVRGWQQHLALCEESVSKVLELSRLSCEYQTSSAPSGFFHTNIAEKPAIQLLQVRVRRDQEGYPEISGNPHRITIRWVNQASRGTRPQQLTSNVNFELGYCYL